MNTYDQGQHASGRAGRSARLFALTAMAIAAFTLAGAGTALGITRATVLTRAQSWVDKPVKYSQKRYHLGYRTDCSGYVSMCWQTGTSWNTRSFHTVTKRITIAQLKPGDGILKPGYHIRLFYGWVDDTHTTYVAYEAGNLAGSTTIRNIQDDWRTGFRPVRYKRVTDGAASTNLLLNGSFDVWARAWSRSIAMPVWWDTGQQWWDMAPIAVQRKDVYKTARNSLQLLNPGADPGTTTQISQTVTITPNVTYTLSAWAETTDTAGLTMRIDYLDASSTAIPGIATTGNAWGVNPKVFAQMAATVVTPPAAVRAVVTFQLGGGSSVVGTATVNGTSALLDAVTLVRR
jgi:hypothetical protein